MFRYIVKRVLIFIPTIIAISLITFFISVNAPGDPVDHMLGDEEESVTFYMYQTSMDEGYRIIRKNLGLDLPLFYFSITRASYPDSIYKIAFPHHREGVKRLLDEYGNWSSIEPYYHSLRGVKKRINMFHGGDPEKLIELKAKTNRLFSVADEEKVEALFADVITLTSNDRLLGTINRFLNNSKTHFQRVKDNAQRWKNYIPMIHFYGLNNQYHKWITKFVTGNFGISYQNKLPISSTLWDRMKWTLLLTIISMIITFGVSIPLGVISAVNRGRIKDRVISSTLFILYSLPNFWIATLLIMFLGGGDYLNLFPAYGVGDPPADASLWDKFWLRSHYLFLPIICFVYPSLAFLSRQMRGGMVSILNQDYIVTAKAKGLSETTVVWKHAFRNSLLPVITLFANVFPLAISGSVVLEFIFSIPGMGLLGYEAVIYRDYPVVYTVMMFAAVLTLIGYLVSDILYAIVDPRITYSKDDK